MRWWKFGIIASIVWFLTVITLAGGLMWYISSRPMGPEVDQARQEKAGEVAGMALGLGLVAVWTHAFLRLRKRPAPGSSS